MQQFDIGRLPTGDIDLSGGDLHIVESTLQHQQDILMARMGDYRQTPPIGVGLADYLDDEGPDEMCRAINRHLSKDGMKVKSVKAIGGKILIDANY